MSVTSIRRPLDQLDSLSPDLSPNRRCRGVRSGEAPELTKAGFAVNPARVPRARTLSSHLYNRFGSAEFLGKVHLGATLSGELKGVVVY
ncbi:hypothetical protein J6590_046580 [Homalodisca vitripennis]|nr:hypothetical protein J6590_046580 [Homalodisca vitripennis]